MAGSRAFGGEARMGQANFSKAILFMKIEAHQGLSGLLVPGWHPGERKHTRTFDDPINAFDSERSSHSDAAHQPTAAGAQIGFHILGFKSAFLAPPFHPLARIDQCLENPRGGSLYYNFLNDRVD